MHCLNLENINQNSTVRKLNLAKMKLFISNAMKTCWASIKTPFVIASDFLKNVWNKHFNKPTTALVKN